jgi:Raf kinase inhibitor-like YbhB/YbcL family protein
VPRLLPLALLGLVLAGCATEPPTLPSLAVTSSAFSQGKPIPKEFSCDGGDRSPPLSIAGLPAGADYVAVVLDDPDAPKGTWTHWTFWDLPAAKAGNLPAGVAVEGLGAIQGTTSAGSVGYHGPCPPGGTHRYFVRAYATNGSLGLAKGASVDAVRKALKAKAVAQGELMGTYSR